MEKIAYIGLAILIILIVLFLAFPVPKEDTDTCDINVPCEEQKDCGCLDDNPICESPEDCQCVDGNCAIEVISFEECSKYYPVMESYPEQCSDGKRTFTRNITDPLNTEYIIDGQTILLENGYSEVEQVPGSASKLITQINGDPVYKDINSDGIDDIALVLTQQGGGSGTFFYLVLIVGEEIKVQLAGDRILIEDIIMGDNFIELLALDREIDEPMTAVPTVSKTVRIDL